MHQIRLQITDELYEQAKRRAVETGFSSVDEYIVDVVAADSEDLDHRFTPAVIAGLDRFSENAKAAGTTYTADQVDDHFKQKSKA